MPEETAVLTLTRLVTTDECPWIGEDLPAGTIVYKWPGVDYGVIGPDGVAVSREYGKIPFFEVPAEAVKEGHTRG